MKKRWIVQAVFNTDKGEQSYPFIRKARTGQLAAEKIAREYRNQETSYGQFLCCRGTPRKVNERD